MDRAPDIASLTTAYAADTNPTEVITTVHARIARDSGTTVWLHRVSLEEALARLDHARKRRAQGEDLPLFGIPFAVKDNIDVDGMPTTAACPAFRYVAKASARVVEKLEAAGAILLGKTNLDQFATGLTGTRSPYGIPSCVFDGRYISGGSSSGSAVAVAEGHVSFALGTDTAGSGRVPAAFNNIVGLKPTKGWFSTTGVVKACRTLDCVSIFTLTCDDASTVAQLIAAYDPEDPFSRREPSQISYMMQAP